MASSTKWRLNVSANNGYSSNLVVGDLELRTAAGVPRPFVHNTFAATVVDAGAASLQGIASLSTISGFLYAWEQVTFPFTVYFGGTAYTKCFVSPNGYIYFDAAGDPNGYEYNPLNGKDPAVPHIILGDGTLAGNSSIHALYAGAETSGTTFRMRLEMNAATTDSTTAVTIWEVTFDSTAPNTVRIDFGTCGQATPLAAIGDGKYKPYVATFPTVVNKRYNVTTAATTADGTATASTNVAGSSGSVFTADQATDVDTNTYWEASAATGWLQYEYTTAQAIVEYVVQSPSNWWNDHTALPKDWTLEYWDGSAWVVADTQTGQSSWTFSLARTYTVGVPYGTTPVTINGAVNIADRDNTGYLVPAPFILSGTLISGSGTTTAPPPVVVPATIDGNVNLGNPSNAGPGFDTSPWALSTDLVSAGTIDGAVNIGDAENYGVAFQRTAWAAGGQINSGTVSNGNVALSLNTPWGMAGSMVSEQINVANGDATVTLWTTAAQVLPGTMSNGDVQLAVFEAPWTLAGTLLSEDFIQGDVYLPLFDAAGSLEPPLALPAFKLAATGLAGTVSAGAVTLLLRDADGVMLLGTTSDGAVTLPIYDVEGSDGINPDITLPNFTLQGVMIPGTVATASLTIPRIDAQGVLLQDGIGNGGVLALTTYTLSATAYSSTVATGNILLPAASAAGTALNGNTMNGAATVPLLSVSAEGISSTIGSAYITMPALTVSGTMNGPTVAQVGVPEVLGLVLNTHTNAVTNYANMPFNSMCNFNGVVLAATAAGIVALVGDTDNGADIDAFFEVGRSDFGSPQLKRVTAGYAGYQADGKMSMTVITDDHHEYSYSLAPRNAEIHTSRVIFGRGLRSRYWQWRLANVAGAGFMVDSMSLDVENLSRRV